MAQGKKWNIIVSGALFVLAVVVVFLTSRNDCRFNEEKELEAGEIIRRDSSEYKHLENMSSMLKETTIQLDSIRRIQQESGKIELQNNEAIKKSLNQIRLIEQQILNAIK